MRVSDRIRAQKAAIGASWEEAVRRHVPSLGGLDRAMLIDHLPELLDGLAAWVDGDRPRAYTAFEALVVGHALQRLGHGIDLGSLTIEYQVLRTVLLRSMLELDATEEVRTDLIRLNEGLDEAVLKAVRRYVAAREELRERFIGILGHDLRAPLQVVSLALARMREGADDAAAKTLDRGQRAVERMDRMIKDVLDFARTQLGQGLPARPTANDMGAICRAAVDESRGAHPGRRIVVTTRGDLRGFWDHDRVAQALTNLIANAIAHGEDPIDVRAIDQGAHVVTEVENPGPPIPEEVRAHLFEPFRRGPTQGEGLGLGLYIVGAIALTHGAICDVIADGTTNFRITWPRVKPEVIPGRP
ncbi:MAG TPA: HAMP domain-containing sensor histidine kinase [Kofleriaceae bacterium]|nr:HAMP domain-containing sensor histidine kinase [Kofleriaceae bacterium]